MITLTKTGPKAEFDGTDGLDGLDGWDGLDGPEKCPLNFFILFGYIDKVCIYSYTKKIVTNILMGLKI